MAKLHEMGGGGGMHAQADNESPQNAHKTHTTLGFHALKEEMHKQTDVKKKKRRKRGGVTAAALLAGSLRPPRTSWDSRWAPSFCKAFWELSGTQNESKIGGVK